jgi:hypothetical protein
MDEISRKDTTPCHTDIIIITMNTTDTIIITTGASLGDTGDGEKAAEAAVDCWSYLASSCLSLSSRSLSCLTGCERDADLRHHHASSRRTWPRSKRNQEQSNTDIFIPFLWTEIKKRVVITLSGSCRMCHEGFISCPEAQPLSGWERTLQGR